MTSKFRPMELSNYKHVHLIGVGGISISAVAKLFLHNSAHVSGSDKAASEITEELEKLGVKIFIGHKAGNVAADIDLVVYSEAVPKDNVERAEAARRNIKQLAGAEFWGEFARAKKVVAVSGTNGKSSTTALLGLILEAAGFDPTVVVGTKVLEWGSQPKAGQPLAGNIRLGESDWLVIEADEYNAKMLSYFPQLAVITNLAPDHLDFYKNLDDVIAYFQKWIEQMPAGGTLVLNKGDEPSLKLKPPASLNVKYFALPQGALALEANALAATTAALALGIPLATITKALSDFKGTWRRFETVGQYNGALIISDYAHHPDGIRATLAMAKKKYPDRRLVLLYQPHQHNRTKNLFNEFVKSFDLADELILAEIYDVAGRTEAADQKLSSKDLVEAIKDHPPAPSLVKEGELSVSVPPPVIPPKAGRQEGLEPAPHLMRGGGLRADRVHFAPDLVSAEQMLRDKIHPKDMVIVMGAGDVDKVARDLVKKKLFG